MPSAFSTSGRIQPVRRWARFMLTEQFRGHALSDLAERTAIDKEPKV